MQEVWKSVKGYDNRFMISSFGRLSNSHTGKILSQTITGGYFCYATKIGGRKGKAVLLRIHRLVAEAFLDSPSQELLDWAKTTFYGVVQVNHKDGNKTNNIPENLEWCSNKENSIHAHNSGLITHKGGILCDISLFDDQETIDFIRKRYIPFCKSNGARALAREYGCSHDTILKIINHKRYKSSPVSSLL